MLLLDILAEVASDTMSGGRLFAALKRQFFDETGGSLDVRSALERRRRREQQPLNRVTGNQSNSGRKAP